MINLTSVTMVDEFIKEHKFSFIYISRTDCSVCHALLPQIVDLLKEFPHIKLGFINADDVEDIAGRFLVLTVPALLLFIDGKEMIREARFVHIELLREKIVKINNLIMN